MNREYYTVEQISQMLHIHPKTIQRYIREGKLQATKIGKSWRISGHELSRFVEERAPGISEEAGKGPGPSGTRCSAVLDLIVTEREEASRITNSLAAAMNSKPPEYGPSSMQAQYLEEDNTLRVSLFGSLSFLAVVTGALETLLLDAKELR